jgi:hypothetical protein
MGAGLNGEEKSSYQEVRGGGERKRRETGIWRLGFGGSGVQEREERVNWYW